MQKPEDTTTAAGGSPLDGGVMPLVERLRLVHEACGLTFAGEAADELERLSDALATESSRKCATEHDCVWQPHCAHAGKCMRPERPAGA